MQMVECGSTVDNIASCYRHTFMVNNDAKEGLHWLCVPSIVVFGWSVSLFGLGNLWATFIRCALFLAALNLTLLNHQAAGLGIPKG